MDDITSTSPERARAYTTHIVEGMHGYFFAAWQSPYPMPRINLKKKTGFDRFGVRIGMNKQILTGDPLFDEKVWIDITVANEVVLKFLENRDLRKAALFLFNFGFDRIEFADTTLRLIKKHNYPTKAQLDEVAPVVNILLAGIPELSADERTSSPDRRAARVAAGVLILSVVSLFLSGGIETAYPPLDSTGWAEIILIPFALVAIGRLIRGYPNSFALFCFSIPFVLVTNLMLAYSLVAGVNGSLDRSPPTIHSTTVTSKDITTDIHGFSYYHVRVASWRPGETDIGLKVSNSFYNSKSVGDPLHVTTRTGALGLEWVVSFR